MIMMAKRNARKSRFNVQLLKEKKHYRLLFKTSENRIGILYKISAALYVHNWNIIEMSAMTNEDGDIEDSFLVTPVDRKLPYLSEYTLLTSINRVLESDLTVMKFISRFPGKLNTLVDRSQKPYRKLEINSIPSGQLEVLIETQDRPGLIFEITQVLYRFYFDIIKMESQTINDKATDRIYVKRESGKKSKQDKQILMEALGKIIN